MGAIARSIANKITTSGVFTSSAITNSSVTGITVLANASDGITLISSQTASSSASLSFTTGLDSTYKAYKFVFSNIRASSTSSFTFNLSTDSGSNYNVTKTSSMFIAYHYENDSGTSAIYDNNNQDLSQSTSFQSLLYADLPTDADTGASGTLTLFNPSSTTYVKHFISNLNQMSYGGPNPYQTVSYLAGYGNTTSAINAIQFKMSTGNIADGKIYLYGIK
jgi:hypothetical protein